MQCCIPHPCSSPETRRFREDSEKILRRFEDAESFAKAHFEYVVDLQGVSFATSWPCRAHQVLAPQCGTGWHFGGTWEAHGRQEVHDVSMCFTDFHGIQHAGTIVYNCLHGGILRTLSIVPAATMLCALEPLQTASKQYSILFSDPQRFGRYEGVFFCSLSRVHQPFPTEPLLVPGAEMIRWPMIEVLGHAKFRCMISWISWISILFIRKHELRVLWLHAAISCAVD